MDETLLHSSPGAEPRPAAALMVLVERLPAENAQASSAHDRLVLPFERREKARQRARLASGREVGIKLPRGTVLRGGDRLRSESGAVVEVIAAREAVSTVASADPRELARAAYHLGNRHVAVEIGAGWLRYVADHVLDAMVEGLGLRVTHEQAPFEPEAGAYGAAHAPHSHGHGHSHADAPAHDDSRAARHSHGHEHVDRHPHAGHRHAG